MKYLDWQPIISVGVTLIHDYWLYWRLPQIQYWKTYETAIYPDDNDVDDKNKAA